MPEDNFNLYRVQPPRPLEKIDEDDDEDGAPVRKARPRRLRTRSFKLRGSRGGQKTSGQKTRLSTSASASELDALFEPKVSDDFNVDYGKKEMFKLNGESPMLRRKKSSKNQIQIQVVKGTAQLPNGN